MLRIKFAVLILALICTGGLNARQDYANEFTVEFSSDEWADIGCPSTFHADLLILNDGTKIWGNLQGVPTLNYPFGQVKFSLEETAAIAFSRAGPTVKMQVVTRNGQNYIGTVPLNGLTIDTCRCEKNCEICNCEERQLGPADINVILLHQRCCVGTLTHPRFHSVVLVTGDRFPVIMDTYHIQLTDGIRDFSIVADAIVDVQFRGGLYGFLRGEALDRELGYAYVKDEYLPIKLAKDDSRIKLPWSQIDRIRGDMGEFMLTTPYHFQKWVPDGMVYVPGGRFSVGAEHSMAQAKLPNGMAGPTVLSTHLRRKMMRGGKWLPTADSPSYIVQLPGFFVDKYEVTNEEYAQFCAATGHPSPAHWVKGQIPRGMKHHPVVNVSYFDAESYAKWAGKRLPTEVEWERAAKGISSHAYPYGPEFVPGLSNVEGVQTATVGSYEAVSERYVNSTQLIAQPVQDMSGNVAEWTASRYESASKAAQNAGKALPPVSSATQGSRYAVFHVVRGGAFDSAPETATTTHRVPMHPNDYNERTGFRCARDAWSE